MKKCKSEVYDVGRHKQTNNIVKQYLIFKGCIWHLDSTAHALSNNSLIRLIKNDIFCLVYIHNIWNIQIVQRNWRRNSELVEGTRYKTNNKVASNSFAPQISGPFTMTKQKQQTAARCEVRCNDAEGNATICGKVSSPRTAMDPSRRPRWVYPSFLQPGERRG